MGVGHGKRTMSMIGRSFLFKRDRGAERVKEGAIFRHYGPGQQVETAQVLHIQQDFLGIPHVRFSVRIERPDRGRFEDGPRILNLQDFVHYFSDQVVEVAE
jgi:hypothetical protein